MKYAFMTFSCPDLTLDAVLATAKRYGYDGVELRIQTKHGHALDVETDAAGRKEARQKAADAGVALCCVATSCKYADPETITQMIEDTRRAIDLAGDIGAPRIRVFGGTIPEGVSRDDAIARLTDAMKQVADQAKDRDVIVCMETHDDWCDPAHLAAVIKGADHPNIAVNWDIMHPVRVAGKTIDEAFDALKPWIRHVHCHDGAIVDGKLILQPIGEGIVDHKRALEVLKTLPYDGYISGEWINWEPYDVHLPRELAILKRLEADY